MERERREFSRNGAYAATLFPEITSKLNLLDKLLCFNSELRAATTEKDLFEVAKHCGFSVNKLKKSWRLSLTENPTNPRFSHLKLTKVPTIYQLFYQFTHVGNVYLKKEIK